MNSSVLSSRAGEINSFDELLYKGAADGNIEPFKTIAQQQQLNLIVTPIKNTVLHINILSKKASMKFVEEILEICSSLLCQVNDQGNTPLHVAVIFKRMDIVEVLVKHAKAQPDELENGIGVLRGMLRKRNNKGNTALHEAMLNAGDGSLARILVEEDPDFSYCANNCGETPLYIAAENKFFKVGIEVLKSSSVAYEGPNGKTALHAAVKIDFKGLTRKILEKKKNLTKERDENGWTPLHCAAYYGCRRVARTLLEFDTSAAYVADKYRKMTPLHLAAGQGHTDIIKDIILYCPDCYELVDDRGWNVLHFAMTYSSAKELRSLLENPLIEKLLREKDAKGNNPLHVLSACTRMTRSLDDLNFIIGTTHQVRVYPHAVNKRNVNAADAYKKGYPELEQEILALSKDIDNGPYPLGIVRRRGDHRRDEYFKQLKGAKESHLIAAALIATVTFAAAFTLPGGYRNEEGKNQGTAILSRNSAFQAFIITDAIAMVFSISAVFIYVVMSFEMFKKYIGLFALGAWITVVAMGAMVIAFVTGTYAVLAPSLWLAIVTCSIGLSYFLLLIPVGCLIVFPYTICGILLILRIRSLKAYLISLLPSRRRQ